MNAIAVPTYETQTASSNGTSSTLQKSNISAITRRDIIDKLCTLKIEGGLN